MRPQHNNRTRCSSEKHIGIQGDETSTIPVLLRTSTCTAMCFCNNTKTKMYRNHNNRGPQDKKHITKTSLPLRIVSVKKKETTSALKGRIIPDISAGLHEHDHCNVFRIPTGTHDCNMTTTLRPENLMQNKKAGRFRIGTIITTYHIANEGDETSPTPVPSRTGVIIATCSWKLKRLYDCCAGNNPMLTTTKRHPRQTTFPSSHKQIDRDEPTQIAMQCNDHARLVCNVDVARAVCSWITCHRALLMSMCVRLRTDEHDLCAV